eukprot:TRINITY_DN904_c0_g1_i1.p1 TRINITY_DN904_c0_g1~~TRINITY_DN904_c0_g1_i1.p1  ORF type:complete len:169 (+),score=27.14 TRINITY_DN904_c0_g1_i1:161-667(+)
MIVPVNPDSIPASVRERTTVKHMLVFPARQSPTPDNTRIVGWVRGELSHDEYTNEVLLDPSQFIENVEFEPFLQDVLEKHIYDCPEFIKRATELGSGWMNIYDKRSRSFRTVSEDTLGSVELKDGKMVPASYTAMPTHRLMSERGELFQLSDFIKEKLDSELNGKQSE